MDTATVATKRTKAVHIDVDVWKRVKKAAADEETSLGELVTRAVEQYLNGKRK